MSRFVVSEYRHVQPAHASVLDTKYKNRVVATFFELADEKRSFDGEWGPTVSAETHAALLNGVATVTIKR